MAIVNKRTVTFMPHEVEGWREQEINRWRQRYLIEGIAEFNHECVHIVEHCAALYMPKNVAVTIRLRYARSQRDWVLRQHTLPAPFWPLPHDPFIRAASAIVRREWHNIPGWVDQGWAYRHCEPMQAILATESSRETNEGGI